MRLGRLDKLITVERQIITGVTPLNEAIYSWETYRQCWAEAYDIRSDEVFITDTRQRLAETTTRFRIHFNDAAGIDATMRIKYSNALFDIKSIVIDHVRKQSATIDAVAQNLTVSGAALALVMDANDTATVGEVYQHSIHVFGGVPPYVVALTDGSPAYALPPGLNLVQVADTIWGLEGYPTTPGAYPVSIVCTDAANNVAFLETFILTIYSDGSPQ